jgi:hypothetical protein
MLWYNLWQTSFLGFIFFLFRANSNTFFALLISKLQNVHVGVFFIACFPLPGIKKAFFYMETRKIFSFMKCGRYLVFVMKEEKMSSYLIMFSFFILVSYAEIFCDKMTLHLIQNFPSFS